MYTIWADDVCIYDDTAPDRRCMTVSPKLTLAAGAAGSLNLTLPQGCAGYDSVRRLMTTIGVRRDDEPIWMGRVLADDLDFWKSRTLMCEGALAWLNDFVIPTATYSGTAAQALASVIAVYNGKAAANRRIDVGTVTVTGSVTAETDYNSALDAVNRLVSDYGGVLRMRYEYDLGAAQWVPTLDWLADYPESRPGDQTVEFGVNLMDFTRGWDMTDYATVAIVRGAEYDSGGQKQYYMGSAELTSAIGTCGRIEKFLTYPDCDSQARCEAAAAEYLAHQYDTMRLEVSAVDLHVLNPAIRSFDLLQRVPVSSAPHDFTGSFVVLSLDVPLDEPGNTRYSMTNENVAYKRRAYTLTQKQQAAEDDLYTRVAEEHAYTEAGLDDARDYADDAASAAQQAAEQTAAQALETVRQGIVASLESMTEGYVFIDYNASGTQGIYITSSPITDASQLNSCQYSWRWTSGGLAHYTYSSMDGIAITHDGKINANMILTGLLLASYIKLYGDMAVYDSSNAAYPSGYIGYGAGHNGYDSTQGIHMYTGFNQEIIVTDYGARMTFGSSSLYVDGNDANANCDMYAVNFYPTSDRNAKKNIEYDPEKYAKLFDLLRPCSFEYRQTDPDIRHTGFIAQDIEEVLADAGLTPEEFGCLRKREIVNPATKEKRTEYSLSYNDLVPLCVDQIQRLKQRVKELEA